VCALASVLVNFTIVIKMDYAGAGLVMSALVFGECKIAV
jgi:hypothetical protein